MSHAARTSARAALAAALFASVLLTCERALACSCIERTPAEAYAQAVSVFEGHVLEIVEPPPGAEGAAAVIKVRLAVVRAWKGMEQEQVEVTTATNSAKCGFGFALDQNYLVYVGGSGSGGGLSVSLCSRTRPIEQADEDVHVLGLGATPVDPKGPESEKAVNTVSAQPRPATKGGCASCTIGHHGQRAMPSVATLALLLALAWRARRVSRAG